MVYLRFVSARNADFPAFLAAPLTGVALSIPSSLPIWGLGGHITRAELFLRLIQLFQAEPVRPDALELPDAKDIDRMDFFAMQSAVISECRTGAVDVLDSAARLASAPLRRVRELIDLRAFCQAALMPVMGQLEIDRNYGHTLAEPLRITFDHDLDRLLTSLDPHGPYRVLWEDHRHRGVILARGELAMACSTNLVSPWVPGPELSRLLGCAPYTLGS
ncbi:hypothetical protein [Deinococcus sonorensis]|uniref:Uncharacterized protein n=2 Tax=Deinococcus sonorensis TaxID=309891 RepID=A0AAU7UG90_9DEIO